RTAAGRVGAVERLEDTPAQRLGRRGRRGRRAWARPQARAQVLAEGRLVPDELAAARTAGDVLLDQHPLLGDELAVEVRVHEHVDVAAHHASLPPSMTLSVGLMIPCSTA